MRLTFRHKNNLEYWTDRWDQIDVDSAMTNEDVYPLKYAKMVEGNGEILEAGCGAGRILRYYQERGFRIVGIDFVQSVIDKLKDADSGLEVQTADIKDLPFKSERFTTVLAFGLYHNFYGDDLDIALEETYRVMSKGGKLCASFRADNIQNRINDWLVDRKCKLNPSDKKCFHKSNIGYMEYINLIEKHGFKNVHIYPVVNMPLLYKFSVFRKSDHKSFNETKGREEGYKLNSIGNMLQNSLIKLFPNQFCNVYVAIAEKGTS